MAGVDAVVNRCETAGDDIEGFVDRIDPHEVTGWAWSPSDPHRRVSVTVQIDGRFEGRVVAHDHRPDVRDAGKGDGRYGFRLFFSDKTGPRPGSLIEVKAGEYHLTGSPREILASPIAGRKPFEPEVSLATWLGSIPVVDSLIRISDPTEGTRGGPDRLGSHPTGPRRLREGLGCATFLTQAGAHLDGPLLQICAGESLLSEGLVRSGMWDHVLLTDPSPAALMRLRSRLEHRLEPTQLHFGILQPRDARCLPEGAFSTVVLPTARSLRDIEHYLQEWGATLQPGGMLTFDYRTRGWDLIGATLLTLLPHLTHLTPSESRLVASTLEAMMLVHRSDGSCPLNLRAEDVDRAASDAGFTARIYPGIGFGTFVLPEAQRSGPEGFLTSLAQHLMTSFAWPPELAERVPTLLERSGSLLDNLAQSASAAGVVACARPRSPSQASAAYSSRFGGLWPDRLDFGTGLQRRVDAGIIAPTDVTRWREWRDNGVVVLEGCVDPALIDAYSRELDALYANPDPEIRLSLGRLRLTQSLSRELVTPENSVRLLDHYVYSELARKIAFEPRLVEFLKVLFEEPPLLFQSLGFEYGSQQSVHQDPAYVVVDRPRAFVGVWIALEDVLEGSGELAYYLGSNRLPEYRFSRAHKHWNCERDGEEAHNEWLRRIHENAAAMQMPLVYFRPKKGTALIWHADVAHGGLPITRSGSTRRSFVGHYCPASATPHYFSSIDEVDRAKLGLPAGFFTSYHYPLGRLARFVKQ
jgi:phytanoyl-CoA hydroxylase